VYNNLSMMLEAGVPVRRSVRTAVSAAKGELGKAWGDVGEAVWEGDGLAEAMRRYPQVFAELDVLVIEAGEVSGELPDTLKSLSQWYEFCDRMKKRVIQGMMLPVLVLIVAGFAIPFVQWFMEKISGWGYLLEAGKPLAVLFVPVGVIWGIVRYTPKGGPLRTVLDTMTLKVPLIGRAVKELALSRYFRAFHTLFKAGIPVIRCAETSAAVTGNAVVSGWVKGAAESARMGHRLSEGFGGEFPKEFLDAWLVGEESGKLEEVSGRLAKITSEKAEWMIAEVAKWVPILIYGLVCLWMIKMIFTMWGQVYTIGK